MMIGEFEHDREAVARLQSVARIGSKIKHFRC
jgi:hypothetical protein